MQRSKDMEFRCEPLASLLRALGYTLTAAHPYGRTAQRRDVTDALETLSRGGRWEIEFRDIAHLDSPLDRPEGALGDDIWITYIRRKRGRRKSSLLDCAPFAVRPWTATERTLAELLTAERHSSAALRGQLGRVLDELSLARDACKETAEEAAP